jgi:hypothetical protein
MTSCDDYLDINQDPNSPSTENVTNDLIFPAVEMNLAASYGDYLRIVGGYYAQQYCQSFGTSNYLDYSRFIMSATRSSNTYAQLFTHVLNNLKVVLQNAEANEEWGTFLAATTLRVYTYQILVDAYGEAPYAEALDISNTSPAYDEGATIYNGILEELNFALSKAAVSDVVPLNFLFGGSTAADWIPFANALKLKLLMRISNVEDVQSELTALVAEDNFPTEDVSWDDCWTDASGKASPYYQEEYATYFGSNQINVVANIAYMQTMISNNDMRYIAFFEGNDADGSYTGGVSGTNFSTSTTYQADYFCRPVFSYDMPVYLISVAEVEFFKAEYFARYGTPADAEVHYIAAIEASFVSAGLSATDATGIYTTVYPYDQNNHEKLIGIQKWIALGGINNFEAWCEMRRIGYPEFGTVSGEDIFDEANDVYDPTVYVPGTLYTPINVNTELGLNTLIQRFKYAESSANRNINVPATKDDSEPVFWAQ